jgi:Cys-rich repeat protein
MRARGRRAAHEGQEDVKPTTAILAVLLASATAAGCGGLDSPDLSTGQVSGRLTGNFKKGAAFAYVLGAPETKVLVADDGSYTLDRVPVASSGNVPAGTAQVVLFDGDTRADIQLSDVKPASHTVVAAARCSGGASGANTVYSVDGAALKDDAKGDVASIFPLPPGLFKVRARLSGFKEKVLDVDVTKDADLDLEMDLEVDEGDAQRGCVANGCTDGRECDDHDGACYGCTSDSQCAAGQKCDNHVCVADGTGPACASCAKDGDCDAPSGLAGRCVLDAAGAGSVCTSTCNADTDCPAGFACNAGVCAPPSGCASYFQTFGSVCFQDSQCALSNPKCLGASGSTPGFCTASCSSSSQHCPESLGYSCKSTSTGNFCSK